MRVLWGVLASLALDPTPPTRDLLTRRFWPDTADPGQGLRNGLSALRKAFDPEIVTANLRLAPGTTCDLLEFRDLAHRARLSTGRQRLLLLQEAQGLLQGRFLDGCEAGGETGWIHYTRNAVHAECVNLLVDLLECQHQIDDTEGAFDTAQRILLLDPTHAAVQAFLLTSPYRAVERLRKRNSWEEAMQSLTALPLAAGDRAILETLLAVQVVRLPAVCRPTLHALSVFAGPFTAHQAAAVADASSGELERFVGDLLLHCDASGQYTMREPIRQILWRRLTGEQRRRLQERYALHVIVWANTVVDEIRSPQMAEAALITLQQQTHHLERSLLWLTQQPTRDDGITLMANLATRCHPLIPLLREYRFYLEGYLKTGSDGKSLPLYANAMVTLVGLSLLDQDDRYLSWLYRYVFPATTSEPEFSAQVCIIELCLTAYHHRGDDTSFDHLSALYLAMTPPPSVRRRPLQIIAENLMARRRYAEALAANETYWSLVASTGSSHMKGYCLHLMGGIHLGLGHPTEARRCWNEALEHYEHIQDPHGIAQCLERIGKLSLRDGMLTEARRLVIQSIELFQKAGDQAAVAAAEGTLGDILMARGERAQAHELYVQGLRFWQRYGHARWIERFEERLQPFAERPVPPSVSDQP